MHQERHYPGRVVGTALKNPDFAAYAGAFGGYGATVEKTADFFPAFEAAQKSGKPAILHLKVDPEALLPTSRSPPRARRRRREGKSRPIRRVLAVELRSSPAHSVPNGASGAIASFAVCSRHPGGRMLSVAFPAMASTCVSQANCRLNRFEKASGMLVRPRAGRGCAGS